MQGKKKVHVQEQKTNIDGLCNETGYIIYSLFFYSFFFFSSN